MNFELFHYGDGIKIDYFELRTSNVVKNSFKIAVFANIMICYESDEVFGTLDVLNNFLMNFFKLRKNKLFNNQTKSIF